MVAAKIYLGCIFVLRGLHKDSLCNAGVYSMALYWPSDLAIAAH